MSSLLATWLMAAISVMILAWLLPGIHVSGFGGALIAAAVISIINALVKPFFQLITLPITILTLGFFLLIINAICLVLADALAGKALEIDGFGWAFIGAIALSIISALVQSVLQPESEEE